MGTLVHVTCSGGDIDDTYAVGVGMLGIHSTVAACPTCRDLVTLEAAEPFENLPDDAPCPVCATPTTPAFDGDDELVESLLCPRCSGQLAATVAGMWD